MLNKKGSTLIELVISIVLISVVLVFLMRLLVDLNNTETNNTYAKDNQIIRSEILRTIENDFNENTLKGITDKSNVEEDPEALKVEFSFEEGTSSLEVLEESVIYKNVEGSTRKWSIKDGTIYPNKASVNITSHKEDGKDGVYVLEINIEIHTSNDLNTIGNDNILDNITISYIGKYTSIKGNLTCLGVDCSGDKKIEIEPPEAVYYSVTIKTNNATASETKKIAKKNSSPEFAISANSGYKFANYTCTNSQDGNFNNGIFSVEKITDNTECTINYVENLTGSTITEYGTTSKYRIRIYGTTEDGLVGTPIYNGADWAYNDFLNAYEKDFEYVGSNTIPDISEMFKLDGYKDNNNYTRVSKELDGYFLMVPVYPLVGKHGPINGRGSAAPGNKLHGWNMKPVLDAGSNNQRMLVRKVGEYYQFGYYNGAYGYLTSQPASTLQTWTGLEYEIKYGYYERFGDWKEIELTYQDTTSIQQQWAFIYDSHGNFFIRNRQSGDYVRNGSTAYSSSAMQGPSDAYGTYRCPLITEIKGHPDGVVAHTGNWEVPIITTPVFKENDAYRFNFFNIDGMRYKNRAYQIEYYKYLRYSDTSVEFTGVDEYVECIDGKSYSCDEYDNYVGTIKDIKTTISKGTSNYLLSDIDGDIVHLYPQWIKK